jgi:hypothetical protein
MTHGEQEAEAVRERRRRARDATTMFERQLVEWRLKAAREDQLPIDRAVSLRRERRERRATGMAIWLIGSDVNWWVLAVPAPITTIAGIVMGVMGVCCAGYAIVLTRRIKQGRGPSGFPPREAPMTDELPAEHRAKAAREDRE